MDVIKFLLISKRNPLCNICIAWLLGRKFIDFLKYNLKTILTYKWNQKDINFFKLLYLRISIYGTIRAMAWENLSFFFIFSSPEPI